MLQKSKVDGGVGGGAHIAGHTDQALSLFYFVVDGRQTKYKVLEGT